MKQISIFCLLLLAGCATKYIVPANRFLTPESQGGALRGQFEIQKTSANQLTIDTSNNTVTDGVNYSSISRTGFLFSNSIFNSFDLYWSHVGAGNSMLGGKFQFAGGSRTEKATGHKMAVAAAFGGNDHETEDKSIEFTLSGQEFLFLYGYRFTENILTYSSFSYATYTFNGKVSAPSRPAIDGTRPDYVTKARSLSGGVELSFLQAFAKLELTYQQLLTSRTKDYGVFTSGFSVGLSW